MKRIAFYGGTFDPVHCGHLTIAERLIEIFVLDEFVFLPAFHAPHKPDSVPTSGYHRFAMLALATANSLKMRVSTLELEHARKRYTVETLPELTRLYPNTELFFVMGADSWRDIRTWREWERVLTMTNHIVVTRPGYPISTEHVTDEIRARIVDLRIAGNAAALERAESFRIYVTDAVSFDVSSTEIREDIRADEELDRQNDVAPEVAKYIEKYELYK